MKFRNSSSVIARNLLLAERSRKPGFIARNLLLAERSRKPGFGRNTWGRKGVDHFDGNYERAQRKSSLNESDGSKISFR